VQLVGLAYAQALAPHPLAAAGGEGIGAKAAASLAQHLHARVEHLHELLLGRVPGADDRRELAEVAVNAREDAGGRAALRDARVGEDHLRLRAVALGPLLNALLQLVPVVGQPGRPRLYLAR